MNLRVKKYVGVFINLFGVLFWCGGSFAQNYTSKSPKKENFPQSMVMQVTNSEGDITTMMINLSENGISFNITGLPKKKGVK